MKSAVLLLVGAFALISACPAGAAQDPAYVKATNERAARIVSQLELADATRAARVQSIIAEFYRDLNALQAERDGQLKALPAGAPDEQKKELRTAIDAKRAQIRDRFVQDLAATLTPAQVEQVKDGLTYGVLPLTFRVYQEMLPDLTAEQKAQLHAWLVEARELAIAGFTSEEKHGFFGKYKGRINNYLAKAGIDMKKAEKEMRERKKGK